MSKSQVATKVLLSNPLNSNIIIIYIDFAYQLLLTVSTPILANFASRLSPHLHKNFLVELPKDLGLLILSYADPVTLQSCSGVSRAWRNLACIQSLWKNLYKTEGWYLNEHLMNFHLKPEEYNLNSSQPSPASSRFEAFDFSSNTGSNSGRNTNELSISTSLAQRSMGLNLEIPNSPTISFPATESGVASLNGSVDDLPRLLSTPSSTRSIPRALPAPLANLNSTVSAPNSPLGSRFLPLPMSPSSPIPVDIVSNSSRLQNPRMASILTRLQSIRSPTDVSIPSPDNLEPGVIQPNSPTYALLSPRSQPISSQVMYQRENASTPMSNSSTSSLATSIPNPNTPTVETLAKLKKHFTLKNRPYINWRYLYLQRAMLESNWYNGIYSLRYLPGHTEGIYCVQFDEAKVISGSRDDTIKIWDIQSGRCLRTYRGHTGSILCLQYDDSIIVSGSSDGNVIVWNLETGEIINTLEGHTDSVLNIRFNETYIISCSKDRTIKIWCRKTGELINTLMGHRVAINSVQIVDDTIVSASGDRTIKVWDATTGECLKTLTGHTRGIACVQFDGKTIISGSSDKSIKIWDLETGQCTATLVGHTELVRALEFDNRFIISGSYDQTIKVWDRHDGRLILDLVNGHSSRIFKLSFNSGKLVSCSQDQNIVVWDFGYRVDTTMLV
jgi:WD40 repeat protein